MEFYQQKFPLSYFLIKKDAMEIIFKNVAQLINLKNDYFSTVFKIMQSPLSQFNLIFTTSTKIIIKENF